MYGVKVKQELGWTWVFFTRDRTVAENRVRDERRRRFAQSHVKLYRNPPQAAIDTYLHAGNTIDGSGLGRNLKY